MAIPLKEFFVHKLKEAAEPAPGAGPTFAKTDPSAAPTPAFQAVPEQALDIGPEYFNKFQESLKTVAGASGDEEVTAMATQLDQQAAERFSQFGGDPKSQGDFVNKYAAAALKWAKTASSYVDAQKKAVDAKGKLSQAGAEMVTL